MIVAFCVYVLLSYNYIKKREVLLFSIYEVNNNNLSLIVELQNQKNALGNGRSINNRDEVYHYRDHIEDIIYSIETCMKSIYR